MLGAKTINFSIFGSTISNLNTFLVVSFNFFAGSDNKGIMVEEDPRGVGKVPFSGSQGSSLWHSAD